MKTSMIENDSIPEKLSDLLVSLKFLSQIHDGQKPCMGDYSLVDAKSWWGSFIRTITGESKERVVKCINDIITETIALMNKHRGTQFYPLIIKSLKDARLGITKLMITYKKYPKIFAQIEVVIENIDLQLKIENPDVTPVTPMAPVNIVSKQTNEVKIESAPGSYTFSESPQKAIITDRDLSNGSDESDG